MFPGSNCDKDTMHVLSNVLKIECELLWYKESNLDEVDAVIIPGGFSYGDYLRGGVIAAFSPIMNEVRKMAEKGKPVLGICNGFQILVEARLLPGALMTNASLKFVCKWTKLKVLTNRTKFTNDCIENSLLNMPIAHHQGRFYLDRKDLSRIIRDDQIVFSYVDENGEAKDEANPNGSTLNIAGVCNKKGNVVGLMPHPERSSESILSPFGSEDGLQIFRSLINSLK